jgi:hypothetical protein
MPRPRPGKLSGDVISPKSVIDAGADRRLGGGFDAKLVKPGSKPRPRPRGKLSGDAGPHSESLVDTSASSDRRLDGDAARKPRPRPRPGKLSGDIVSPKSVVDAGADRRLGGGFDAKLVKPGSKPRSRKLSGGAGPHSESLVDTSASSNRRLDGDAAKRPRSRPRPGKLSGDVVSPKSVVDVGADRRLGGGFDAKLVKPGSKSRPRPRGKLSGDAGPHSESLVDTSASSGRRLHEDAARKPRPRPRPGKLSGDVIFPKSVIDAGADRRLGGGFDAKLVKPGSKPRLRPRKLSGDAGPHSESLVDTSASSDRRLYAEAEARQALRGRHFPQVRH